MTAFNELETATPGREHTADGTVHIACKHTEALKSENPEQYQELLKALAELEDCRAQKKELVYWEMDVIDRIHDLMPRNKMTVPGIGIVTAANSGSVKWDNEGMFNVLTARALDSRLKEVDEETGEIIYIEKEAHAVRRVLEECAGVGYWRKTPLKEKYGVDPDEYLETANRKKSIRIQ